MHVLLRAFVSSHLGFVSERHDFVKQVRAGYTGTEDDGLGKTLSISEE